MVDLWNDLGEKLKALSGAWGAYAALGSFALYLSGYLSLRFHLTALGIGTDLAVLDERYLFTGARSLVYLTSCVPIVVMIGLVVCAVLYAPYRLVAARRRTKGGDATQSRWACTLGRLFPPARLALAGIVLSVGMIQVVMRQCFLFSNLLFADRLPPPTWLQALLLSEGEGLKSLYFSGLIVGTTATAGLLILARAGTHQTSLSRLLGGLLTFLLAVQVLLLPVNYGILIADKTLPKVGNLGTSEGMPPGQDAWLVWEGKDSVTYLVRTSEAGQRGRALVTFPRGEVKQIRIIDYDQILRVLFVEASGPELPTGANGVGERRMPRTSLSRHVPLYWLLMLLLAMPFPRAWAESFSTTVLRIFGISASPSQMRGPDEEGEPGNIWLVDVAQMTQVRLTHNGGYRSPVFSPTDDHILALTGNVLVRLPATSGAPEPLHTVQGVTKIVGFDKDDPDKALILLNKDGGTAVALLSLQTGLLTFLPYDPTSKEHQSLLTHMQEWERTCAETTLYLKSMSKRGMAGVIEWTDVYLKRGDRPALNLSRCDKVDCSQPSLSHDGRQVVYIRAERS